MLVQCSYFLLSAKACGEIFGHSELKGLLSKRIDVIEAFFKALTTKLSGIVLLFTHAHKENEPLIRCMRCCHIHVHVYYN